MCPVLGEIRFEKFMCHLGCVMYLSLSVTVHRCVQVHVVAGVAYFFVSYHIPFFSLAMNKFPYQNEYRINHKYHFGNNLGFLVEKHELLINKAYLPDCLTGCVPDLASVRDEFSGTRTFNAVTCKIRV